MKFPLMLLIIGIAVMNACHHDPVIPTTPVTFEGDVKPIILNSCARTGCHVAGGEDPRLTSYTRGDGNSEGGKAAG